MNNIDFYFSIGSTYTYLSVTRALEAEKQHQIKFSWTPFSVRAIMKEMNNVPFPKEKKNKVDYMWRDIERRAKTAFLHVQECQHTILWRCDHALPTGVQCVPRADFPLQREASTRREREERSEVCPHLKVP